MSTFSDYKEYRNKKPEYGAWKDQREQDLANKVSYIKTNPIPKDEFKQDVERAKIVLDAVNIMDEYSQSRAEEMEQVTETAIRLAAEPITYASFGLAGLALKFTKGGVESLGEIITGNFKNVKKVIPAGILYILPAMLLSAYGSAWGAKKEIQASREGRQEAMNTDLASVKQFAVLDEKQQAQVEQIAQGIEVSKEDSKKIIQNPKGIGMKEAIKTIFKKDDAEKFQANVKLNEAMLTEEQILEAKKDKELVQTIVEKIDIASQDYAEDTENAIAIASTIASTGGIATAAIASALVGLIKPLTKYKNIVGIIVGGAITLGTVIYGAKLQKQASRVARFKVKQDLLNNPEQLVYVDEEKYKNQNAPVVKEKQRNFIENIRQIINDNKEYNQYIKDNNTKNIQIARAKEQIELTPEQEQRAKQLQQNAFNMFNKLDEKSQRYSESAEAVGAVVQIGVASLLTPPAIIASMIGMGNAKTKGGKILAAAGYLVSILSTIGSSFMITKDQKNASRVANMEAIKELDDYRYFTAEKCASDGNQADIKTQSIMSPMLKRKLNNTT